MHPSTEQRRRLQELAVLFLKLGTLAFGGPAAHIAMMEAEVVQRRGWMTGQQLLDLIGATNLIPGPNSTELAIHIGYERAGWRGLLVAGVCFIFPAMLIVWALAAVYVHYHTLPQVDWLLYGIKPVMIAIVAQALWRLGTSAVKNVPTVVAGVAVIVLSLLGWHVLLLLLIAGLAVMLAANWQRLATGPSMLALVLPVSAALLPVANPAASGAPVTLMRLFGFFLKIGSVLYGSGYVLLAFLQDDLVERWQWLTTNQLLDAIAIGQVTPGPVFTTATFIGYVLAGHAGALLATLGIFLPSFGRCSQSLGANLTSLALGQWLSGRCQCGLPGPDGRCHLETSRRGAARLGNGRGGTAEWYRRLPLSGQRNLAGAWRWHHRVARPRGRLRRHTSHKASQRERAFYVP